MYSITLVKNAPNLKNYFIKTRDLNYNNKKGKKTISLNNLILQ